MTDNYKQNSTRFLFDLQACQSENSAFRGVGFYSKDFFSSMNATSSPAEVYALLSSQLPFYAPIADLNPARILKLNALPAWKTPHDFMGGDADTLDSIAYTSLAQTVKPDVIHISHVFEGFVDRIPLPNPSQKAPGQIFSATLYDLIPMIFQDQYFVNTAFKQWYLSRCSWLRQADLLLAISHSSKKDAIDLLGIDPSRIVTVYGGIRKSFLPLTDPQSALLKLKNKYPLRKRMVLYTGGDDYRKNLKGVIEGFARIPKELRQETTLFLVCAITPQRKAEYLKIGENAGLALNDIFFTGSVSEEELVFFYGLCDVMIFPSHYEGLGLPILEAMACGAPVLAANNSSLCEIVQRADALFDSGSLDAIAASLVKVLTDDNFARDLRQYGLKRAKDFSWERTTSLAHEAFDEALKRSRFVGDQSALCGWLPRSKMAVLSPLPPSRSGIADYNAQLLPFLSRHFDIDLYVEGYEVKDDKLSSSFRIFDVKDFERVAKSYEIILYDVGNSEFHAHMIPLMERFPGVVVLHDAYLSGLMGYLDFNLGASGSYIKEMLKAHGPRARQFFTPMHTFSVSESMINLPCTKKVLDHAIGIISHSPFNLELARNNYPEGWLAPYHIIPQIVQFRKKQTDEQLLQLRTKLGFKVDDFIIASFGHINWTKWSDRLLEAFVQSNLSNNKIVNLVFVGELAQDEFGINLKQCIEDAKLEDRIRITGYLTESDYEEYLQISNLAVQLRTKSRGGSPKGVLDCLAFGVPVIVNDAASYVDYPNDVVIKLSPEPSTSEIANTLSHLIVESKQLKDVSAKGLAYVQKHHNPILCAALYAVAIHEFIEKHKRTNTNYWVQAFAPYLSSCTHYYTAVDNAAVWLENLPAFRSKRPRLFIDVSHISAFDHKTGIQRVVKGITRGLYCMNRSGWEPIAVNLVGDKLCVAYDWLNKEGLFISSEIETSLTQSCEFESGDILLMLDSSWERYSEFHPIFAKARLAGVPIITAVYDILPLTLPAGNFVPGGKEFFENWFHNAVSSSDALICISKAVADDVISYVHQHNLNRQGLRVGYWHLGSNFMRKELSCDNPSQVPTPYFLMVGTIEPRKSHELALQAMQILWSKGIDIKLCIAGKKGWLVDDLIEKIRSHPSYNKNLFLYEQPTDEEIAHLYLNATALLFLSKGEGFGLPLIEAAHYGVPIICSDLPVFREVATDNATYVNIKDPLQLADQLALWLNEGGANNKTDSSKIKYLTWEESAGALLNVVVDQHWYWSHQHEL